MESRSLSGFSLLFEEILDVEVARRFDLPSLLCLSRTSHWFRRYVLKNNLISKYIRNNIDYGMTPAALLFKEAVVVPEADLSSITSWTICFPNSPSLPPYVFRKYS